jgi:hypothetical protein
MTVRIRASVRGSGILFAVLVFLTFTQTTWAQSIQPHFMPFEPKGLDPADVGKLTFPQIDGLTAVSSVYSANDFTGVVYVMSWHRREGWVVDARLLPSQPVPGEIFGTAVALSDDTLAVSAPGGRINIYERKGFRRWVLKQIVPLDSGEQPGQIALSDHWMAVSVGIGFDTTYVRVFARDRHGNWRPATRLSGDQADGAQFGSAMGFSRNRLAIAAFNENNGQGAVYIYSREPVQSGIWSREAKLTVASESSPPFFGESLGFEGDTLASGTGAYNYYNGAVFIFERSPSSEWVEQTRIDRPDEHPCFGDALTLNYGILLTSGTCPPFHEDQPNRPIMHAYWRDRQGQWTGHEEIIAPSQGGNNDDNSVHAISSNGLTVFVRLQRTYWLPCLPCELFRKSQD